MGGIPSVHPFPAFLEPTFSAEMLARVDSTIAVLDAAGIIVWVNPAWEDVERPHRILSLVNTAYLDGIAGPLRAYFEEVLTEAMTTGEIYEQTYDCSSPTTIRPYQMRVLPFPPHGMMIEHTPIAGAATPAPADPEDPSDTRFLTPAGLIVQCSNCRRIRDPNVDSERWVWVSRWVARSHPRTSHGICTPCLGFYWRRGRRR
ncbi:MAG: PAS domain-containing protein [Proteobacteria bacterium]|nr:PAS domain-containing protein [Pseudomonadota bacterium]